MCVWHCVSMMMKREGQLVKVEEGSQELWLDPLSGFFSLFFKIQVSPRSRETNTSSWKSLGRKKICNTAESCEGSLTEC